MSMKDYGLEGFKKIGQDGCTYIVATFWNEETDEVKTECVRDYDYNDCRNDIDELYYMPIDKDARLRRMHNLGFVFENDLVEVFKGRKVPIGTVATIKKVYPIKDMYGRTVADYVLLSNGMRTNINNCRLVREETIWG